MMRAIMLMIIAVGMIVNGIVIFGKEPTAIEKTGWAYRNLGANGVSEAMLLIGALFLLIGFAVARSEWKKHKQGKEMNMDI